MYSNTNISFRTFPLIVLSEGLDRLLYGLPDEAVVATKGDSALTVAPSLVPQSGQGQAEGETATEVEPIPIAPESLAQAAPKEPSAQAVVEDPSVHASESEHKSLAGMRARWSEKHRSLLRSDLQGSAGGKHSREDQLLPGTVKLFEKELEAVFNFI